MRKMNVKQALYVIYDMICVYHLFIIVSYDFPRCVGKEAFKFFQKKKNQFEPKRNELNKKNTRQAKKRRKEGRNLNKFLSEKYFQNVV